MFPLFFFLAGFVVVHGQGSLDYDTFADNLAAGATGVVDFDLALCTGTPSPSTIQTTYAFDWFARVQQEGNDYITSEYFFLYLLGVSVSEITVDKGSNIASVTEYSFQIPSFQLSQSNLYLCEIGNGASLYTYGSEAATEDLVTFEDIKAAFLDNKAGKLIGTDLGYCSESLAGESLQLIADDVRHSVDAAGAEYITLRMSMASTMMGGELAAFTSNEAFIGQDNIVYIFVESIDPTGSQAPTASSYECALGDNLYYKVLAGSAAEVYADFESIQGAFLAATPTQITYTTSSCTVDNEEILQGLDMIVTHKMDGARWSQSESGDRDFTWINNWELLTSRNTDSLVLLLEDIVLQSGNTATVTLNFYDFAVGTYRSGTLTCPISASGVYLSALTGNALTEVTDFATLSANARSGVPMTVLISESGCVTGSGEQLNTSISEMFVRTGQGDQNGLGEVLYYVNELLYDDEGAQFRYAELVLTDSDQVVINYKVFLAADWSVVEEETVTCAASDVSVYEINFAA